MKRVVFAIALACMSSSIAFGATTEDIAWAQTCLTRLGFTTGPVDGLIGPKSMGASIAYLRSRFGPHFDSVPEKTRQVYFAAECLSVEPTTMALHNR